MIQHIARASRRNQTGFTLIELLVVIIVLGILSAVVVFAVTGVGDKGKANAIKADAQTLRTAEESYCATNGRYGTHDDLVGARLLSERSTYNVVMTDDYFGPCGGTRFQIYAPPLSPTPGCGGSGTWCAGMPATGTSTTSGNRSFSTSGEASMRQLPNGTILAKKGSTNTTGATSTAGTVMPFQLFDPAVPPKGSWSPVAGPATSGATTTAGSVPNVLLNTGGSSLAVDTMLPIKGNPATCGTNCGKVLVHFKGNPQGANAAAVNPGAAWSLYDPNTPASPGALGRWQDLSTAPPSAGGPYRRTHYNNAVQITSAPCGQLCGKFLIVGQGHEDLDFNVNTPAIPEVWDPADGPDGSFRKLVGSGYQEAGNTETGCGAANPTPTGDCSGWWFVTGQYPKLRPLNDGRVLMYSGQTLATRLIQMFDPITEKFTTITPQGTPPPSSGIGMNNRDILLEDGRVLSPLDDLTGTGMSVYHPDAGPGRWTTVSSCADPSVATSRCSLIDILPDGKVLARRRTGVNTTSQWIFDPTDDTWTPIGSPTTSAATPANSVRDGLLIREMASGSCGNICNRVLAGGTADSSGATMSLFTP